MGPSMGKEHGIPRVEPMKMAAWAAQPKRSAPCKMKLRPAHFVAEANALRDWNFHSAELHAEQAHT